MSLALKEFSRCVKGCLLPMWRGVFAFMEHAMNLIYRERINNLLARLPGLNHFAYYQMFLARLERS